MFRLTSCLAVLVVLVEVGQVWAGPVIAESGFNDATGINSDAVSDSPFQLNAALPGQGNIEPGWAGPWGGSSAATVQTAITFEGDGAGRMTPTRSIQRKWAAKQTGEFVIEYHMLLTANSRYAGYVIHDTANNFYEGPVWWAMPDGTYRVHDGIGDSTYDFNRGMENTGLTWTPDVWHKVSLHMDVADQTWEFFVDDQKYNSPDPLGFRGSRVTYLNGLNFLAEVSGNGVYFDSVRVIPEPSTLILLSIGAVALLAYARRRRR